MSEYNMSHTGEQLDDAINKVKSGYVLPDGITEITSNGEHDVSKYKTANVNVPKEGGVAVQEILEVSAEFNFGTGQAENFSHTYAEIVQATNDGKIVKLIANYMGDGGYEYAIGDLIHYREGKEDLEFAVFVYSNILTIEHALHHFRIIMNEDNTTQTTIAVLSGGSEAVQETMSVTADFSFSTMQITNLSHSYNEIFSAVAYDKKLVKIAVLYVLPGQTVQNTAIGDFTAIVPSENTLQFGLLMRANLGSGDALYYFSIYVRNSGAVSTDIQLINSTTMGG